MDLQPEGYAIDKKFPDVLYVPQKVNFDLHKQTVSWQHEGKAQKIKLLPANTYVRPSGFKVRMEKPAGGRAWRLVGTAAEGTLCHKPCTVSGGGKSEISKSITDAIIQGPVFVADFKKDFDFVEELITRSYAGRFRDGRKQADSRPILSPERSLGSVIRLLTQAPDEYTQEYAAWLDTIPRYVRELVFVVKRFYKPEWGEKWREHFSVEIINGVPAHELKCDNRKLVTNFLRVGYDPDGSWRTFGLRKDFSPAGKLQQEDDITASVVVPVSALGDGLPELHGAAGSVKFVKNCEYRLFQRPDDAIHRGYDRQTESDFAMAGNFFSNYEPLNVADAVEFMEDAIGFDKFTEPMQHLVAEVAHQADGFFVSSANPRLVGGKPSKNPRYLQTRPDLLNPRSAHLAEIGTRLRRRIPLGKPVLNPVNAVLPGRRNNPPEEGVRPMAVFNPIHYLELPELFMEFICSMTGKSPSTTGAGSEGALTKGPFNALPPIIDLNNALVSFLLTGHSVFVTAAGYVGPNFRVDHDVSLLAPEIWCRMSAAEREPAFLIKEGYLEKCEDFEYKGRTILASRFGYRITKKFVIRFFGLIFHHPVPVFSEEMLRPELQSMEIFVDGVDNIIETQKRVAQLYFNDGTIDMACPPLRALLHIMLHDQFEGKDLAHPDIRALFTVENMLSSDWYAARLEAKSDLDLKKWTQHAASLKAFLAKSNYSDEAARLGIAQRLEAAEDTLAKVKSPGYADSLRGTLGLQPLKAFRASA